MGFWDWLVAKLGRGDENRDEDAGEDPQENDADQPQRELREFVYLDRDSVVSLLASLGTTIPQQHIQQLSTGSESHVSSNVGTSVPGVQAGVEAGLVNKEDRSTEVVHNYAVQSLFDNLDQHRRSNETLAVLPLAEEDTLPVAFIERGDIVRVEVELESHYLYRFYRLMFYIAENMPGGLGPDNEEILDLIGSMFGNRIPVRGRLMHYGLQDDEIVRTGAEENEDVDPVEVVGHLEVSKIWQDIPDALADGKTYVVFGRVDQVHLESPWHPLSIAQRMESISPPLARMLTVFMEQAAALARSEVEEAAEMRPRRETWLEFLNELDEELCVDIDGQGDYHAEFLDSQAGVPELSATDPRATARFCYRYIEFLEETGVELDRNQVAQALNEAILEAVPSAESVPDRDELEGIQLEANIVAVYW